MQVTSTSKWIAGQETGTCHKLKGDAQSAVLKMCCLAQGSIENFIKEVTGTTLQQQSQHSTEAGCEF